MLYESQNKWSNFSNKLLKISEDLYYLLENTGAIEIVNDQWVQDAVAKIKSYWNYLNQVIKEKTLGQSNGGEFFWGDMMSTPQ